RDGRDLLGLDQGGDLEEFIEGTEAPGEINIDLGGVGQHHLAGEEVVEGYGFGNVRVQPLFHRQADVEADRAAADLEGADVPRFHDTAAAAGNDGEALLGQAGGERLGVFVVLVGGRQPRAAPEG